MANRSYYPHGSTPTEDPDRYWTLLRDSQQSHYPGFVSYLSQQIDHPAWEERAAMIEFKDNARPTVKSLARTKHFEDCFKEPTKADTTARRLFILEGLPRNLIKVLGARLKVPPSFFSAHWIDPKSYVGHLVNRTPRHHDNPYQFQLSFMRLHQVRISPEYASDVEYWTCSKAPRSSSRWTLFGDQDGPLASFEQASFWGRVYQEKEQNQSWDAIIIVDPPLSSFVRCDNSAIDRRRVYYDSKMAPRIFDSGPTLHQEGLWHPPYQFPTALSPNSAEWSHEPAPNTTGPASLFDEMLTLYPREKFSQTSNPNICTEICRRLILSEWTARLRIIEAQIVRERLRMSVGRVALSQTTKINPVLTWRRPWQQTDFNRLTRATAMLESVNAELRSNIDALGINKAKLQVASPWEEDAWNSLRDAVQWQSSMVKSTLETYMQAISVRQSLNAGYLTSMATIFIPVSLIAAVFSMGGDFAAGESLFWVFWVIAIPVTLFGCFVLFTRMGMGFFQKVSGDGAMV